MFIFRLPDVPRSLKYDQMVDRNRWIKNLGYRACEALALILSNWVKTQFHIAVIYVPRHNTYTFSPTYI